MRARLRLRPDVCWKGIIALELIWVLAGAAVLLLRSARPDASKTIAFLRAQDVAALPAETRAKLIADAAARVNALTFEESRGLRESRALFHFYRVLTSREKEQFAALVIEPGLRRIVEASRDVPAAEREQFLGSALYHAVIDFSTAQPPIDPETLVRIEREAVESYAASLRPEERAALAPLLDQLRKHVQPSR